MQSRRNIDRVVDQLETLGKRKDIAGVSQTINDYVRAIGFERYTYHVVRPPAGKRVPFYLSSYPDAWVEHYVGNNYVNSDAVIDRAACGLLPFDWQSVATPGGGKNSVQKRIFNEAGEFGIHGGASVPIHGPGGSLAILNVASDSNAEDFRKNWSRHRHDLQVFAMYAHEVVLRELYPQDGANLPHLSPRERECLLWTSKGKTAAEIAAILNISQETVVTYLKQSCAKLDVFSKTHAVVKAVCFGLIVP
ncbi:helix-turn-helix transcriptional regulator [Varunaivibrio sulfuroxidans]|uniref:LuxR family transcriptional regulator n=1 Tax=Varunaivibrio sulfuroxidans TaxID=1773489 RepID=A0A4R3J9D9_9PROT|nr:autoinducer binding domain-containing protein [Varunaivibrio sulfuroxidans]TCS62488.1 LuxR family transcriptional regulator [Varunaivibrio sulfuroxidans]WES30840.1 autoinducer binding domain-containing protein [Varunaivibrio sulfuroxidans]